jgi:NAD(P)-dependent dehydrogenase (short-subunit alcohol dehydrogenase family)
VAVIWDIRSKEVLITGGNSGIGKATAKELARRGALVTITARDPGKGRAAVKEILDATGIEVSLSTLDLSRLDSVREMARSYLEKHDRLDVLINNAGVMAGGRRVTADGFEWTFAVNYLGPFLLTHLLLDRLRSSAPSRIITVSSENYRGAKGGLDFDDLQMSSGYSPSKAYAASKLANILWTVELDRRFAGQGIAARALHPGVVATSFGKGSDSPKSMGILMTVLSPFLRKPDKGARTSVHLATAEAAALAAGLYWSDEKAKEPTPAATDLAEAARLWAETVTMLGIED